MIESYFLSNGEKRFTFEASYVPKGIYSFNTKENRNTILCSPLGEVEICTFPLKSKEKISDMKSTTLKIQSPVNTFRCFKAENSSQLIFGAGGINNLMKIYDVETQKCIFKAKNQKADFLGLQPKIAVSDIAFLGDGNLVANSTLYHEVRIYDRRAGKKPITQKSYGEYGYSRMISSPLETKEVIVGTINGNLFRFDFKNPQRRKLVVYKGSCGSIRDLSIHPNNEYLASCGADRHIRVFDLKDRKELFKTYITQRQNACLFTSEEKNQVEDDEIKKKKSKEDLDEEDELEGLEDDEDAWDRLEHLEQEQKKKKKKVESEEDEGEENEEEENEEEDDEE